MIGDYYEQLDINILHHLEKMDKLLEIYNRPRLSQKKIENPVNQLLVKRWNK